MTLHIILPTNAGFRMIYPPTPWISICSVTIYGSRAAHRTIRGDTANFDAQKPPLTPESCSHGTHSQCAFPGHEK